MSPLSLTWDVEVLPDRILRLAFAGRCGAGSLGNADGESMQGAIEEAITASAPAALLIDCSALQYSFGDWMFGVPLRAVRRLGAGRVCVLAVGETAAAMGALWALAQAAPIAPLFQDRRDAIAFLSSFLDRTDA